MMKFEGLRSASFLCSLAFCLDPACPAQAPLYTFTGDVAGQQLGSSVGRAGDVNRDGFADVIVGLPLDSRKATWSGAARVFSGRSGAELHTFRGERAGDRLGFAVAGAGDVNGDGFDDLIAGSPYDDDPSLDAGSARVFSGRDGATLLTVKGLAVADNLGWSVAAAGDVNRDGFADVIVGSPFNDLAGTEAGRVVVVSGRDGSVLWQFLGDAAQDLLGWSVAGAGDVDGDGFDDVLAGAIEAFKGGVGYARIWSGRDGSTLRTIRGFNGGDQLGTSVAGAGDTNRDGVPDVVIGLAESHRPGLYAGSAVVVSGRDGTVLHRFDGEWEWGGFGASVGGTGDVDGDGAADVVVGSVGGYVKVFSGAGGSVLFRMADQADRSFGAAVSGAGDVNGDGTPDFIAGAFRTDFQGGNRSGTALVFSGRQLPLAADTHLLSLSAGGSQAFTLAAGAAQAARTYVLLGSLSGIRPGFQAGTVHVPLNPDDWFVFTLTSPNTFPLVNSLGLLDGSGKAAASFGLPPGLPSVLDGLLFDHAFVVFEPGTGQPALGSNPVPLTLSK